MFRSGKSYDELSNLRKKARQAEFESLVNAYSTDVFRFALWLVRDRAQAEDLVQETFLRAWKSIDSLRDPKAAKSWLITILRRERARCFGREQPQIDAFDDIGVDTVAGFDVCHDKPEHIALRRALDCLDDDYREPLLLQVVGGYTCDEIGELMGITPGAVMTRLSRTRQRLANALTGRSKPGTRRHAAA